MGERTVEVPGRRIEAWADGFRARHGGLSIAAEGGVLRLTGADGAQARLEPVVPAPESLPDLAALAGHVLAPRRAAVVLVRRGGFACAIVAGGAVEVSRTGTRYVQGRTAAGGWSQQRFARRRAKQTAELVDAAADLAAALLVPARSVDLLVTGGDRRLAEEVLADPRLRALAALPHGPHLAVPDPRADVVRAVAQTLVSARVRLRDAPA